MRSRLLAEYADVDQFEPFSRRVLIVEDDLLISMFLEEMLQDLGYEVMGTACRLDEALTLSQQLDFDVAILDMNLAGESSAPVAQLLEKKGIPFVLATGYRDDVASQGNGAGHPVVTKPFGVDALQVALAARFAGTGGVPGSGKPANRTLSH
jgi:DNA-binding response OmpR family regulator